MSLGKDESAVSEIVGALMLVVVVSSAAFGFGVFLHQQAKLTQAQKASEAARKLENLEILAITPLVASLPAPCTYDDGAHWTSLSVTVASRHLADTVVSGVSVNGMQAKFVKVGATTHDFSILPNDPLFARLKVAPRATVNLLLDNVASDQGCTPDYSFFPSVALTSAPFAKTDSLDIKVLTDLTNKFERVFIPPSAIASVEPAPTLPGQYVYVGTSSQPGTEGGFITSWSWERWDGACGADGTGVLVTSGHRYQTVALPAGTHCVRLTVTDNSNLSAQTEFTFTS